MKNINDNFSKLFRKYRLRSEFETLTDFGNALANKGHIYENSIFSRWQKGTRTPKDRKLLLIMIGLFIERGGITSIHEVNEIFETAGQGYLTNKELSALPTTLNKHSPFQPPRQINDFIGRDTYVNELSEQLIAYKTTLLYGPAGIGKTALAIKIAHTLHSHFPDGVLWYRLDTASVSNILASIAFAFGEDITRLDDIHSRASIVRSILQDKRVLIVFDNLDNKENINLLLPNSKNCAVLITSTLSRFENELIDEAIQLEPLSDKECLSLFEQILGTPFIKAHKTECLRLSHYTGQLPLAIQIIAKQIKYSKATVDEVLTSFMEGTIELTDFAYESKNFAMALQLSFSKMEPEQRAILLATALFEGEDFSEDAISYITSYTLKTTKRYLTLLAAESLIEKSKGSRWRLHPLIKLFLRQHTIENDYYLRACRFYNIYLKKLVKQNAGYHTISASGITNITYIFEKCYQLKYYEDIMSLWESFGSFLWDTGNWSVLHKLALIIYKLTTKTNNKRAKILCCIKELSLYYYWQGDINKAETYTTEGLLLAQEINDKYLISFAKERLGKIYIGLRKLKEAETLLQESLTAFTDMKDNEQVANAKRNLAEVFILNKQLNTAEALLLSALTTYEDVSNPSLRLIYKSIVCYYLGAIMIYNNDLTKARDYFRKSISYAKDGGERSGESIWAYMGMGLTYELMDNMYEAKEAYIAAKKELLHLSFPYSSFKSSVFYELIKEKLSNSIYYEDLMHETQEKPQTSMMTNKLDI